MITKTLYIRSLRSYKIATDTIELAFDFIADDKDQGQYNVTRRDVNVASMAGETMNALRDLTLVWENLGRPKTRLLHPPRGAIGSTFALSFSPHLMGVEACPE